MNNNILFCSVGRRARLLKDFRKSLHPSDLIVATDLQPTAPALYFADRRYVVPRIDAPDYLDQIMDICHKEQIKAITTLIDPEIAILAQHRQRFLDEGILPLCPDIETARLCFDKYALFEHLQSNGIRTVLTYDTLEHFEQGLAKGDIRFPVFIKPRTGSGSVGIHKVNNSHELKAYFDEGKYDYIIQEFMDCEDCDADVYIDCITHRPVAMFSKHKLETRIGGANKTTSFKDERLFDFIKEICHVLRFNGPVDMDFWYRDNQYYLSEVNPRFGGAYLHAYGAGVNFVPLIVNNINGIENKEDIGNYDDDIIMMMYDDVVIVNDKDLAQSNHGR